MPKQKKKKKVSNNKKPTTTRVSWKKEPKKFSRRVRGAFTLRRINYADTPRVLALDEQTLDWGKMFSSHGSTRLVEGQRTSSFSGGQSIEVHWLWSQKDDPSPFVSEQGIKVVHGKKRFWTSNTKPRQRQTRPQKASEQMVLNLPTPSSSIKTMMVFLKTDDSAVIVTSEHTPEELRGELTYYVHVSVVDKDGQPYLLDYLGLQAQACVKIKASELEAFLKKALQ